MAAKRLPPLTSTVVALFAAAAAWLTGGALTLTSVQPGAARIGILPSPVWLGVWLLVAFITRALRSKGDRFALLSLSMVLMAPWIPLGVPSAFYIWTGPLHIWLWTMVIAGLAAPTVASSAPA